ncbi:restriction endonuclease subunit S [Reichenbachiella ulvae]|uniref:Restriction endonuclease subunit S n=1 Tax=Reichenbachiella ulvae TaxID=2980104 RepID=A0ABT3CV92_9BACT|nr:restriction endonuclease subunit S [Reichenbachiella ulvae]MCV9387496.1 restriction endonuclease subunit S [Reichenbachiella ulvae]
MSEEWKEVRIGDYCKLQGGYAFKSNDFQERGVPVVKIKNIQGSTVTLKDSQCFSEEDVSEKLEKFKLNHGDVLIAMTGAGSVGRVGRLICCENEYGLLNQRVGRFDVNPIKLNREFLYYVLIQPRFQEALFMAGSGSGQPNLSPSQIESFKINLPPLPEQKAIAKILGDLDAKIELNRQMNQTLEQMAQALFQSWFVDFDPVIDNALAAGHEIPEPLRTLSQRRKDLLTHNQKVPGSSPGGPTA